MALIKCSECGKEISDKAETCIHCGCPLSATIETPELEEIELPKIETEKPKTHPLTKGCAVICAIFLIVMVISYMAVYMGGGGSSDSTKPKKKIHSGIYKCVDGDGAVFFSTKKIEGLTCTPIMIDAPEPEKVASIPSVPNITEDIKNAAIDQIEQYTMIRDAAIGQKGRDVTLTLIVNYATSEGRAKELGDNFIRMVKGLSPDEPPGKQIGTGIYDYMIGVYYPNEKKVALGAKVRISPHITW